MLGVIQNLRNKILKLASSDKRVRLWDEAMFPEVGFLTSEKVSDLESILNISIRNKSLYEQALTHRSYLQIAETETKISSNERMEFLGDAILGMIVAEYLFYLHSDVSEGELTKLRSRLVNKQSLAYCAEKLGLKPFIVVSASAGKSLKSGNKSIVADAMEAVIAAVFLDHGIEYCKKFIVESVLSNIMDEKRLMKDSNYKSLLLELTQSVGMGIPTYEVVQTEGPDHDRIFTIEAHLQGKSYGVGKGSNKKSAEQNAAREAYHFLQHKSPS